MPGRREILRRERTGLLRRLSIYGFDAVNNGHNMYALLEFDVTDLRRHLREQRKEGGGGSLFAFLVKAIALCLGEEPSVNAIVDHRWTTEFSTVDVSVPIEIITDGKPENRQCLIRDAARRPLREISDEIEAAKREVGGHRGYILSKPLRILMGILPRRAAVALIRLVMRDHVRIRALSGTVFVTSVSMFSSVPGFIIPYVGGPKASSFAIGSSVRKPVARGEEVAIREMLNVTAVFNHDALDGAPAARFINRLRRLIEVDYRDLR